MHFTFLSGLKNPMRRSDEEPDPRNFSAPPAATRLRTYAREDEWRRQIVRVLPLLHDETLRSLAELCERLERRHSTAVKKKSCPPTTHDGSRLPPKGGMQTAPAQENTTGTTQNISALEWEYYELLADRMTLSLLLPSPNPETDSSIRSSPRTSSAARRVFCACARWLIGSTQTPVKR